MQSLASAVPCAFSQASVCAAGSQCFGGLCLQSWSNVPCVNPWANPALAAQENRLGQSGILTSASEEWSQNRDYYCAYSKYLHFIVLGCAFLLFMEVVLRFTAHQGPSRFFFSPNVENAATKDKKKSKAGGGPPPKRNVLQVVVAMLFGPLTAAISRLHTRNVVDTLCMLITVGGVVITDLSFTNQARIP